MLVTFKINNQLLIRSSIALLVILLLAACKNDVFEEIPFSKFEGNWRIENNSLLKDVEIKIVINKSDKITGSINNLNNNKFVLLLCEKDDLLITNIKRLSNYEFEIKEKKIGAALFGSYGLETSRNHIATFLDDNTILLGKKGSKGKYIRIKE